MYPYLTKYFQEGELHYSGSCSCKRAGYSPSQQYPHMYLILWINEVLSHVFSGASFDSCRAWSSFEA